MYKSIFLIAGLLIFCTLTFGQETSSVVIFKGRKVPYMEQKVLDLSNQNLSEVPIEAFNREIEILILDNNKIEKLPIVDDDFKLTGLITIKDIEKSIEFPRNIIIFNEFST